MWQVGRVISQRGSNAANTRYLVKWAGLEYNDSTWETKQEICKDKKGRVSVALLYVFICSCFKCSLEGPLFYELWCLAAESMSRVTRTICQESS
jgi:hypothetical protein